jgi:L-ascorbate metabolism protein UlaG (beta-lactamase superfamily)
VIDRIQWTGHGSFFIQGPPLIYINPSRITRSVFHADVILISHHHDTYFSVADIEKLRGPQTRVLTNALVARELGQCEVLRPWQSVIVDRAGIKAIPAYSTKGWRYPLIEGGLGFVISLHYYDIYYAGDTERIPEMERIKPDIAILPIDGNDTLNPHEAAEVVKQMRPRWVIPCNWGPGDEANINLFKREVSSRAEVIVPKLTK